MNFRLPKLSTIILSTFQTTTPRQTLISLNINNCMQSSKYVYLRWWISNERPSSRNILILTKQLFSSVQTSQFIVLSIGSMHLQCHGKPSVFTLISLVDKTPCKPNYEMFLRTPYAIWSASMIPCHKHFALHQENLFQVKESEEWHSQSC